LIPGGQRGGEEKASGGASPDRGVNSSAIGGGGLPQNSESKSTGTPFSSFPASFPDMSDTPSHSTPTSTAPGLDYEALTLMRLRQAERERLEREIREQEAND